MKKSVLYVLLVTFTTIVSSCTGHNKYVGRTLSDGQGGVKKYFYAYGKFCGPGWPPSESEHKKLISYWPPKDDLDAICYAHDYCYDLTYPNNQMCDHAFRKTLLNYQNIFLKTVSSTNNACAKESQKMMSAFFIKPNGKFRDNYANKAMKIGYPVTLVGGAITSVLLGCADVIVPDAEEGMCNVRTKSAPLNAIKFFETAYTDYVIEREYKTVIIPVPISAVLNQ